MSTNFARPLVDHVDVETFLENCLGVANEIPLKAGPISLEAISKKIRDAENAIYGTGNASTLRSESNRVRQFRLERDRVALRQKLLGELLQLERLDNDDEIKLGTGGAKPKGPVRKERQAFIIIGLPASGKSSMVNLTADTLGAYIVDSDFAKRKLPEFDGSFAGANLVHEESSQIVFGGAKGEPSVFEYCKLEGLNVVIPKIGNNYESILLLRDGLIENKYEVHLSATVLPREQAAHRALLRFCNTSRYVPLGLIFDGYANDPIMNYYRFRLEDVKKPGSWASLGAIGTDSDPATLIDYTSDKNPVCLVGKGA